MELDLQPSCGGHLGINTHIQNRLYLYIYIAHKLDFTEPKRVYPAAIQHIALTARIRLSKVHPKSPISSARALTLNKQITSEFYELARVKTFNIYLCEAPRSTHSSELGLRFFVCSLSPMMRSSRGRCVSRLRVARDALKKTHDNHRFFFVGWLLNARYQPYCRQQQKIIKPNEKHTNTQSATSQSAHTPVEPVGAG